MKEFKQIVVAPQPNGGFLRLGDVADVQLGAENYMTSARYNGQTAVVLAIQGEPTANSLQISDNVRKTMARLRSVSEGHRVQHCLRHLGLRSSLDQGVDRNVAYRDRARHTGYFRFLAELAQYADPIDNDPDLAMGTFAAMKLFGFSINTLTLFGLTLATGLVVDDAIVVLENIVRHIVNDKVSPFEATCARCGRSAARS